MCATNLWAVNAAAFTEVFQMFTAERLGVEPRIEALRIDSRQVRGSSQVFTLTLHSCDCGSLIGQQDERPNPHEIGAESWLSWLRDLSEVVPHLSRIAVLRAWNPDAAVVTPLRSRSIRIGELDEAALREVHDDMLLTIDYPRIR